MGAVLERSTFKAVFIEKSIKFKPKLVNPVSFGIAPKDGLTIFLLYFWNKGHLKSLIVERTCFVPRVAA
jgi:hypothetical protein